MPSFSRPASSSLAKLIDRRSFSPLAESTIMEQNNTTEATKAKHEPTFILRTTGFTAFDLKEFKLSTDADSVSQ